MAGQRLATLEEVARACGHAKGTVSQVLNDRPCRVRDATRRRIIAAARRLGYRPNAAAQAISRGRFGSVTLLQDGEGMRSNLPGSLLAGIWDALEEQDVQLQLARLPMARLGAVTAALFGSKRSDGLLLNYNIGVDAALQRQIDAHGLPSIWINCRLPTDCVHLDEVGGGALATGRLLAMGRRRIAYLDLVHRVADRHHSRQDRFDGYAQAMRSAGLQPRLLDLTGRQGDERQAALRAILLAEDRPDAVVAYAVSHLAPLVAIALGEAGLRVPRDIALAGFGDDPIDLGVPVLGLISPRRELGRRAAAMLLQRIAAPTRVQPPLVLPYASCGPVAEPAPVTSPALPAPASRPRRRPCRPGCPATS